MPRRTHRNPLPPCTLGAGLLLLMTLTAAVPCFAADDKAKNESPAATLAELKERIQKILTETKTPGAGVALVDREGTLWAAGVGMADVAGRRPATANTLFRIGSVTKGFVSLAVLALVQEGRLKLEDPVRDLAPEVQFVNRWESTDPIRVVHLLEHTTGWDDLALREYALERPGITLEEALAYAPRSRTSRWRPGTRFSYCNAGPAVAALIVAKIEGQTFEEVVQRRFFTPLGMATATFFKPAAGSDHATLYHPDGKVPYSYWEVSMRPAGSVNASVHEMARYARFLLGRGTFEGKAILPPSALERAERAASGWSAKAGLLDGYGLGNYVSQAGGVVWHGHDGGVEGGLARVAYQPDLGVGFVAMINSGSGDALRKIGAALRGYLLRTLPKPVPEPAKAVDPALAERFAGWYVPDSPRQEKLRFLETLLGIAVVSVHGADLTLKPLAGAAERYVSVGNGRFRQKGEEGEPDKPMANLALIEDPTEGRFLQTGQMTAKKIGTGSAWLRIGLSALTLLLLILALPALLLQAVLRLLKRLRDGGRTSLWLWAATPALALAGVVAVFVLSGSDTLKRLGALTPWTATIFVLTLLIPLGTLAGLLAAWKSRANGAGAKLRFWCWSLGLANLVATLYLAAYGLIGLRIWI